jgi:type I restriction enzyme M protein
MLSPQLRKKVFDLWSKFWASGMTNPLVSIEQITYFLFLKQLEALDAQRILEGKPSIYGVRSDCRLPHPDNSAECSGHELCRWSHIRENPTHELFSQYVFPWLRELDTTFAEFSKGGNEENSLFAGQDIMADAYFQFPRDKVAALKSAVNAIDELFPETSWQLNDLMGDIFEYMLSEVDTAGKSGQFRTPRHIIRFMVELLDPKPGERLADPASGSAGFLFSTVQHLLKQATPPDKLRLEADGTPHRLSPAGASLEPYLSGEYFVGYDNDRTMVRIGWMNLILHGVENPRIARLDSLGKSFPDSESGKYQLVLANPPFTGTVDEGDLHKTRFPRKAPNSEDPITTKSELLFVWLLLDLLETDGRGAVIVPEGVLFGSTNAHKELRRQLLFEHNLQAVISLPPGVFQPYAGVKTSILVFQKAGETPEPGKPPCTGWVWFYEVQADGYSLDAKRDLQPEPNDLWDAQVKYPQQVVESQDYHQPDTYYERWRVVDEETIEVFDGLKEDLGQVRGIHELFEGLPSKPRTAEEHVVETQTQHIISQYRRHALAQLVTACQATLLPPEGEQVQAIVEEAIRDVHRTFNTARRLLDTDFEQFGYDTLKPCLVQAEDTIRGDWAALLTQAQQVAGGNNNVAEAAAPGEPDWQEAVDNVVREFAKLDGFNIQLRSLEVRQREEPLEESRSWVAPVRAYARDDEWQDIGTHDEDGAVRPEYIAVLKEQSAFEGDGTLKATHLGVLDRHCIEANGLNLSAGRYKPFVLELEKYDPPARILHAVRALEEKLIEGIDSLLEEIGESSEIT